MGNIWLGRREKKNLHSGSDKLPYAQSLTHNLTCPQEVTLSQKSQVCILVSLVLTPVFLPGEPQGQGSLVGCHLWGRTESDTTEAT